LDFEILGFWDFDFWFLYFGSWSFVLTLYHMEQTTTTVVSFRKKEIVQQYIGELDKQIAGLRAGTAEEILEIKEIANIMHMHPVHLSNTIKEVTGRSSCDLFEERLLNLAKELLTTTSLSVAQIARQLTYDPSNFTKFFKQYAGTTPKKFRDTYHESVVI
jgi:AraC family transcriptional regulator of adaptative response / methylphosphotriester-DNA alkyltransferase methyltransferase